MRNDVKANVRKVAYIITGLFLVLFIYITYIAAVEGTMLSSHPLNRRGAEAARQVERGLILDRHGAKLAKSVKEADGSYSRQYPYGAVAANLVGYDSEKYGTAGVEGAYNGMLSGILNPIHKFGAISRLWRPKAGNTVALTLDADLQQEAYAALGSNRGAVVVLDPRTGAILAMASKPGFDPNSLEQNWDAISSSADSPLLNRALQGLYPPGSSLKVMIAEAALAEHITTIKKNFHCDGELKIGSDYVLPEVNHKAHGNVDLEEALAVSCNVTFGQLSLDLGRSRMAKTFERYGFTKTANEDLGEAPSRLPDFSRLGDGDLAQTGIGQGSLLVTPLRMAMLAAAFANQGTMMKPYLLAKVLDPDGAVMQETKPEVWLKPADAALAQSVGKMMVSVVTGGTGSAARLAGIQVAGKTGTAENPHGAPHAWFIGFAPANNPQVAIAVIVENAGSGGGVAAPIARRILAQALQ